MKRLQVKNFGPIREATVELGDLTVLVGPQASGKSLFVQLIKALDDAGAIRNDLKSYGFDWFSGGNPTANFFSLYFGGGLGGLAGPDTKVIRDGRSVDFHKIADPSDQADAEDTVFLIPAQRVLVLQDGWPRPFGAYSAGDPYCMRWFSEVLRLVMERGFDPGDAIFPQPRRLGGELKQIVDSAIYIGAKLQLETEGMRKRIVLFPREGAAPLPYSTWSAGQREFTPLLLGLYWLMPPATAARRGGVRTVVIEEPEMGLHPQAIVTFGLLVLELLRRGYQVIVSTHSPLLLDLVWAIRELKQTQPAAGRKALARIFGIDKLTGEVREIFKAAFTKSYKVYYFNRKDEGVIAEDISSLDPGAEDENVSGWGGLSGFSGRIAETVGEAMTKGSR